MKTVLLKPHREAVNAVLAYQDEDDWSYWWSMYHDSHHVCNGQDVCDYVAEGGGSCLESVLAVIVDGNYKEYRVCID